MSSLYGDSYFFFFSGMATSEIYTLSLHDALPIFRCILCWCCSRLVLPWAWPHQRSSSLFFSLPAGRATTADRSEEHTSELQSHSDIVCRLLLEKKNTTKRSISISTPIMILIKEIT